MDEFEMVLRCMETFQVGYGPHKRLMGINWKAWDKERTTEIRCVFCLDSSGNIFCDVYPSISGTDGVKINTGETWRLDD